MVYLSTLSGKDKEGGCLHKGPACLADTPKEPIPCPSHITAKRSLIQRVLISERTVFRTTVKTSADECNILHFVLLNPHNISLGYGELA